MMTSTRETRRRALEKQGDDDNDNKVVVSSQPINSGLYELQRLSSLSIKNLPSLVHQSMLQEDLAFSQKIEEKKNPFLCSRLTIYNTLMIQNLIIR